MTNSCIIIATAIIVIENCNYYEILNLHLVDVINEYDCNYDYVTKEKMVRDFEKKHYSVEY